MLTEPAALTQCSEDISQGAGQAAEASKMEGSSTQQVLGRLQQKRQKFSPPFLQDACTCQANAPSHAPSW